jgi:23S rRNA (guanosine2251-2'-O)-methyltransferase
MHEIMLGPNAILESLRAGRRTPKRIYLLKGRGGEKIREILHLAGKREIPISWVERDEISKLCRTDRHQGVVALTSGQRYFDLQETLEGVKGRSESPLFLVLDQIQDTGNLGSLLRTAESAGIDAVIIPEHKAAGLNEWAAKASAGALEYVKVVRVPNLAAAIKRLKDVGIWVIGADQEARKVYYEMNLEGPIALVVGGEGKGLRRLTKEYCDLLVGIPMRGHVSCLNVGVAAGIVIFEILRQRGAKKESKNEISSRGIPFS